MVLRLSTIKIVSRTIDQEEKVLPEDTFTAIDTYAEISKKDEFIIGNLFDYDGKRIKYIWDSKKNQLASLQSKTLNTESIISANEFLKILYSRANTMLDVEALSTSIINSIKEITVANNPVPQSNVTNNVPNVTNNVIVKEYMSSIEESDVDDEYSDNSYENDTTKSVFSGEFLDDDEEPDDFDEQLAIKSQEFLKEHPELKSEMEIVRLLEGN
jgi:hypothetical protein